MEDKEMGHVSIDRPDTRKIERLSFSGLAWKKTRSLPWKNRVIEQQRRDRVFRVWSGKNLVSILFDRKI
jgi:hypothetical protein